MLPVIILSIALTAGFIFLQIAVTRRRNRSLYEREDADNRQARENGRAARARVVDLRRAGIQPYRDGALVRLLLEIFPGDLQPAFSASVVWEIETAALGAIEPGALLPVTVDRQNLRRVFPEIAGAHYSRRYQDRKLFIEDDFQHAPHAAVALAAAIAPEAPQKNTIYRRRSRTLLCGLPLWEIAFNVINKNGRYRHVKSAKARAIFALGDSATGIVAIGSFARGVISIGQFSCGVVSFGAFSIGFLSFGLLAAGLVAAGLVSGGVLSAGGITGGFASVGLLAVARYVFALDVQSPELLGVYELLKSFSGMSDHALDYAVGYAATAYFFLCWITFFASFVARILLVRKLEPNDNQLDSPSN